MPCYWSSEGGQTSVCCFMEQVDIQALPHPGWEMHPLLHLLSQLWLPDEAGKA